MEHKQVVICGAGIAGVSAAYFLSRAGLRDILLVDAGPPLTLTSDRSTECYRNWWPDPEILGLMNRSIDLMEELAGANGNVFRMNRRGYLYVTADPAQLAEMTAQAESISASGGGRLRHHIPGASTYAPSPHEGYLGSPDGADLLLGNDLLAKHYPYLVNSAVGALHVRRAGWISAQQLGAHLLEQARAQGVKFKTGLVAGVEQSAGRVSGVVLGDGELIPCESFVNAAGPGFPAIGELMGIKLPVEAEVHLKLAFDDYLAVVDRGAPLLIWNDPQVLGWREDERELFSGDPDQAWLTSTFPGGAHTRPEGAAESSTLLMLWDYRTQVVQPVFPVPLDDEYPELVLRGLATMLPGLNAYIGRAARPRLDGGYYMRTHENRPLIGPSGVPGAYLIGALSGFGIMSACGAGELLAAHLTGASLPSYARAFLVDRYRDPQYVGSLGTLTAKGEL